MYPQIEIDINKLIHNTRHLREMCKKSGIDIWGVTKCFCAIPEVANAMFLGGVEYLADSRIENLKKLKEISAKKALLRIPAECEADEVVEYSDISLNSEINTLKKIGEAALNKDKEHSVVIMLDLGDLREGVLPDNIDYFVKEVIKIRGIKIRGFGVNLTCYGGVIPDENNLTQLVSISRKMNEKYGVDIEIISGGNSSSMYLVTEGKIPEGINNLRLGESILLGRETAFGNEIPGTYKDVFIFKSVIIELKEKPSVPSGHIERDAFGNIPKFEDRGIRKRAIIAAGRQDIDPLSMYPVDGDVKILGASSDHTIIDITDSKRNYNIGDVVEFHVGYGCLLRACTSDYVKKIIKK